MSQIAKIDPKTAVTALERQFRSVKQDLKRIRGQAREILKETKGRGTLNTEEKSNLSALKKMRIK